MRTNGWAKSQATGSLRPLRDHNRAGDAVDYLKDRATDFILNVPDSPSDSLNLARLGCLGALWELGRSTIGVMVYLNFIIACVTIDPFEQEPKVYWYSPAYVIFSAGVVGLFHSARSTIGVGKKVTLITLSLLVMGCAALMYEFQWPFHPATPQ